MGIRQAEVLFLSFRRWGFDVRGWAGQTRSQYEFKIRACDVWLRANSSRSAFTAELEDLKKYLFRQPPNARTRNHIRQALVGFYDFLIDENLRDDNPAMSLPRLKVTRGLPNPYPDGTVATLLAAARALGPRYRAIVCLLSYTGLRRDEVRTLKWDQYEDGRLRVIVKGGKPRVVPLHSEVMDALDSLKGRSGPAEYVFETSHRGGGAPISRSHFARLVTDVAEFVGLTDIRPHRFRHTFATTLYEQTNDIKVVQEGLGHESLNSTQIYTKLRSAKLDEDMRNLHYS